MKIFNSLQSSSLYILFFSFKDRVCHLTKNYHFYKSISSDICVFIVFKISKIWDKEENIKNP